MSKLILSDLDRGLHIPNTWNCLQSALQECRKPKPDLTKVERYLGGAQASLLKTQLLEVTSR